MKKLFKKSSLESGFTLIELLVVIAIIAILSTIVLASLSQARNRALAAKINSQLAQIPAAVEIAANSGTYEPVSTAGTCSSSTMFQDANSGLLKLVTGSSYPGTTSINCYGDTTSYAVVATSTVPADNTIYCVDASAQVRTATSAGATYTTVAGAVNTTAGSIKCN